MKHSFKTWLQALITYHEQYPMRYWGMVSLWLLTLGWLAFFSHLGSTGLVDETEPLFAEAARQMVVTGDWITPFFNGETRFDKPPLIYWLMAIAYQMVGVNEWAVRLPSAIAALGLASLGFYTLRRFGLVPLRAMGEGKGEHTPALTQFQAQRELSAWLGSAMIALNIETIAWGRTGVSDMVLSGCLGASLLSFFLGYAQPENPRVQRRWYVSFYVFMALAVLTKGPVGIVLPGLIILGFLLYLGNWREVASELQLLRGALLVLALSLPWYLLVFQANGAAFINSFFGYHNVERFTSVVNRHSAPGYFYVLVVLVGFAPWSVYLPGAIAQLKIWRRRYWQTQPRSHHLSLFALAWFGVIFGFFTIAVTKLPSYVLPLMPAAGILVALFWSDLLTQPSSERRSLTWQLSSGFNVLLLWGLAVAALMSPRWLTGNPEMPDLAQVVQAYHLPVIGASIWGLAALGATILWVRQQWRWLWPINGLAFVAFLIFVVTPGLFIVDTQRQLPLRELAATAVQQQQPGEELVMLGFKKPSLVFYSQRKVKYLPRSQQAIAYFQPLLTNSTKQASSLVVATSEELAEAKLPPNRYQLLDKAGIYQLVRVGRSNTATGPM